MGLTDLITAIGCIHAGLLAMALRVFIVAPFSVGQAVGAGIFWSAAFAAGGYAFWFYHTKCDDTMLKPILFGWALCFLLVFLFKG